MPSVGPNYPGTITETGTGNVWTNLANVGAADAVLAVSDMTGDINSKQINAANFSLGIDSGWTIGGIMVEIGRFRTNGGGSCKDLIVQLCKVGPTGVGTDKKSASVWPTSQATASYGGAGDLWGTTWTPAELNASTFTVLAGARDIDNGDIARVDFVRVTVYQAVSAPPPPGMVPGPWRVWPPRRGRR